MKAIWNAGPVARLLGAGLALSAAPFVAAVGVALAQAGGPTGPGQSVDQPPAMCPEAMSCSYEERNYLPNGYRAQMLQVCGANCTSQYWLSDRVGGQLLVSTEPIPGGAVIAVGRAESSDETHPPVRLVAPNYQPEDARCCPSWYSDTTYRWDATSGTLVADEPTYLPADQFPGWDGLRTQLQDAGFFEIFGGA